ncbi:MAG: GrpB family protein, partial [Planctomycetaceae bacterium]|nr:GrpB family protein [Planctomycetaceae bacterium]
DSSVGKRTHHVHVFAQGSEQITRHLAFRDFMNAHPDWAARYSDLKRDLVAQFPDSIERYMDGKDAFIKAIDRLADTWSRKL